MGYSPIPVPPGFRHVVSKSAQPILLTEKVFVYKTTSSDRINFYIKEPEPGSDDEDQHEPEWLFVFSVRAGKAHGECSMVGLAHLLAEFLPDGEEVPIKLTGL